MTELAILVKERGFIKGSLTRNRTFFESVESEPLDDNVISELESRLNRIEPLLDAFTQKQNAIELLELEPNILEAQIIERDEFENLYFALIGKIKSRIASFYKSLNRAGSHRSGASTSGDSLYEEATPQIRPRGIDLPAIKLPNFNGHFETWVEFRDGFKAMIHDNAVLSSVQKFYYLRSCLGKDALAIIQSIQVTEGNYKIAWDLLHDRYEQKALLIHNHIRALFEFPALTAESYLDLRNFFDTITKNLRALSVLGENTEHWDRLLIYLLTNKLDKCTRREWELFEITGELATMKDFNKFLKQRCELLEKIETVNKPRDILAKGEGSRPPIYKSNRGQKGSFSSSYANTQYSGGLSCYFCKNNHSIFQCEKFLRLLPNERCNEARRINLCRNCLRPGHDYLNCMHSGCKKCGRRHNTLLHIELLKQGDNKNRDNRDSSDVARVREISGDQRNNRGISEIRNIQDSSSDGQTEAAALHSTSSERFVKNNQVLLSTAIVYVNDSNGKPHKCRALLDSGSQSNFATEQFCKKLNLPMERVNCKIVGVGESISKLNYRVNLEITSCTSNYKNTIDCLVLKRITDSLPTVSFNKEILKLPSDLRLADDKFYQAGEIDLLLGSSIFWEILQGGKLQLNNSKVYLQETMLGWVVGGIVSIDRNNFQQSVSCFSKELDSENSIDTTLLKFWEIEEVGNGRTLSSRFSEEEQFCESNFVNTLERSSDGRFVVSIPFKENLRELGNSKDQALQRYFSQERRLSKNPYLKVEYDKFMSEYLELGHMSQVSYQPDSEQLVYYMPHHAVVREHSKTTKVRVVFDASMKTDSELSLNDVQCVGPILQDDIFAIVLRFRKYQFVMSADVSKMYRMILVNNDQRNLQRIFWRPDPASDLKCFALNTITYGTASAPYLAVRCLYQLAIDYEAVYPKASESIKNSFYMDDYLEGANSEQELLELQSQVTEILSSAGLQLRKWLCNNNCLLSQFKIEKKLDCGILKLNSNETNKTLGIIWDSNSDTIQYSTPSFKNSQVISKRTILSAISQIYDPLGLLGPIIVIAKMLMQSVWQGQFGWDEELPNELINSWLQFKNNLPKLNNLKLPRLVTIPNCVTIELHGFGDASQKAYGCCLYIRCQMQGGQYFSQLLCAKSRVAPIKKLVTLPRLELCASVLLAQLSQRVIDSLKIKFDKCYFYSDSEIALAWIRGPPSKWKLFVANRVSEIQQCTNISDWYHVSTDQNPADLISRGTSVSELMESTFWWNGPEWINNNNLEKYINKASSEIEDLPEQKMIVHSCLVNDFDIFSRFSRLNKLIRVFSYCLRFIHNSKSRQNPRKVGFLSIDELQFALKRLVSLAQQESFSVDFNRLRNGLDLKRKSSLISLNPSFKDDLIRVGGRLQNSNHNYDKKFPIILPSKHTLTRLILEDEHIRLMHCGPTMLLASIRERFWPISGRNVCKKVVRECVTCFKVRPNSSNYMMGNLPEFRITKYLPFVNTGCDFVGPFLLKDRLTRGAKLTKGYVCIFICLSTKAIHLEIMSDLTTNCFMAAFKRFVGRRGKPKNMYSDNGKTFIGADKELKKLHEFILSQSNSEQFNYLLAEQKVNWHFIPSRAPNFGGIWEAGVKSFKFHFKRIVGDAQLHFEDFNTILVQVESILNSRPLCPLPSLADQLNPLTPAHFLLGRSLTALPEADVTQVPENRLKRYERLQKIIQHFWSRWCREYLGELQVRSKWKTAADAGPKVGAVVLVVEDNVPALKWPIGRIEDVHPGRDGIIRVVTVRMHNKLLKRPVTKICVFPFDSTEHSNNSNSK